MGGLQWCTDLVPCTRENSSTPNRVPCRPPPWRKVGPHDSPTPYRQQQAERANFLMYRWCRATPFCIRMTPVQKRKQQATASDSKQSELVTYAMHISAAQQGKASNMNTAWRNNIARQDEYSIIKQQYQTTREMCKRRN